MYVACLSTERNAEPAACPRLLQMEQLKLYGLIELGDNNLTQLATIATVHRKKINKNVSVYVGCVAPMELVTAMHMTKNSMEKL